MKRSAKVTPFVLAWAMSSVVGPQAAAQTQPANPGTATGSGGNPTTDASAGPATEANAATGSGKAVTPYADAGETNGSDSANRGTKGTRY